MRDNALTAWALWVDAVKRLPFDPTGVPHRFFFFEGGHGWPDQSCCERSAGWMEVMAMKGGLRPKDEKLVEAVVGRELEGA
jgi:hypothetical protein